MAFACDAGQWPVSLQHPRSFSQTGSELTPGTYIGLPLLYGGVGKIVGILALLWLTPLLAGLGVWLMFIALRRWWGNSAGLIGAVVLAICPAYWYAATQPFTPTIPFVVLVGAGITFFTKPLLSPLSAFGGGLCAAIALTIRPHEILWLGPLLIILAIARRIKLSIFIAVIVGMVIPAVVALFWQGQTFGSIWSTGYNALAATSGIGPFTFNPQAILLTVWRYLIQLHWWLTGLFMAAVIGLWRSRQNMSWWGWYLASVAIIGITQLYIYGSWAVSDSPGIVEPTIGNSQVRYLLPLLISLVPLVALLLQRWRRWVVVLLTLVWLGWGAYLVMFSVGDGTLAVGRTLASKAQQLEIILQSTQPNTLIIAGKNDKIVVGHRPTTATLSSADWQTVADGLEGEENKQGGSAAMYTDKVELPINALDKGIVISEYQRLPDNQFLLILIKVLTKV